MTRDDILPPKPFYLVRHGQSEANVRNVLAGGGMDSPLTELGINQAKELASVIHHLPVAPSRIYHSPMQRAKHTATHINNTLQLDMIEIEDLKEHIFGDWENMPWDIIKPLVFQGKSPPNGETSHDFTQRIKSTLHHIHTHDHTTPPMLVAHGGVFHAIGRLYQSPIGEVENCALYYFTPEPDRHHFPWEITLFKPCPQQGLKKDRLSPPHLTI